MPTYNCAEEEETQHYLGCEHGHGPVQHSEVVVFAVFSTELRDGQRLMPNSFSSTQLKKGEVSLARQAFTSLATFQTHVVEPSKDRKGPLLGVATAKTSALRDLAYIVEGAQPPQSGKSICVIDKVVAGDHDGHAALKLSDSQHTLTDKQKSSVRARICADLADTFGNIEAVEVVFCSA